MDVLNILTLPDCPDHITNELKHRIPQMTEKEHVVVRKSCSEMDTAGMSMSAGDRRDSGIKLSVALACILSVLSPSAVL